MDIEDILKRKEFEHLDRFLTEEMYSAFGENGVQTMMDVLGDERKARQWFYARLISFGGLRPYDYCKQGKSTEVLDELMRIEYGIFS